MWIIKAGIVWDSGGVSARILSRGPIPIPHGLSLVQPRVLLVGFRLGQLGVRQNLSLRDRCAGSPLGLVIEVDHRGRVITHPSPLSLRHPDLTIRLCQTHQPRVINLVPTNLGDVLRVNQLAVQVKEQNAPETDQEGPLKPLEGFDLGLGL